MHDLVRMHMTWTTYTLDRSHHRTDQLIEFSPRQIELRQDRRRRVLRSLFVGRSNFKVFARRELAHALLGYEATQITNKSYRGLFFLVTLVLGLVCPSRRAFAHDPPAIAATRLEFDAAGAPKNCNDGTTFSSILANWVPREVLSAEANRRLVVRIRRSPTGGKAADVMLIDASGAILDERYERYGFKTECHKVLYDAALAAANILGAFEKPPEPEPSICPACPSCAACSACPACPIPESPRKATKTAQTETNPTRRAFFGAGVFIGTGFTQETFVGPQFSLGFVPSRSAPRIHIEIDGAWTLQTIPQSNTSGSLDIQVVPLFGSICYSRSVFRMCSGLTTTFFQAKSADLVPGTDESRSTLAGHLRMGAEFGIAGPFSIRVDAFAMLRFWQRSYGSELATLDVRSPFGAGAAVVGVWSWE